jgi:hypothetical protein
LERTVTTGRTNQQAIGYLRRVRSGGVTTARGRPIPNADQIPGFCHVVCDLTTSVKNRCELANLKPTSDGMGSFGYNDNVRAYIEVSSYDRILASARERNRSFFDRLGLPAT